MNDDGSIIVPPPPPRLSLEDGWKELFKNDVFPEIPSELSIRMISTFKENFYSVDSAKHDTELRASLISLSIPMGIIPFILSVINQGKTNPGANFSTVTPPSSIISSQRRHKSIKTPKSKGYEQNNKKRDIESYNRDIQKFEKEQQDKSLHPSCGTVCIYRNKSNRVEWRCEVCGIKKELQTQLLSKCFYSAKTHINTEKHKKFLQISRDNGGKKQTQKDQVQRKLSFKQNRKKRKKLFGGNVKSKTRKIGDNEGKKKTNEAIYEKVSPGDLECDHGKMIAYVMIMEESPHHQISYTWKCPLPITDPERCDSCCFTPMNPYHSLYVSPNILKPVEDEDDDDDEEEEDMM